MTVGKGWAARDRHCRKENFLTCGVIILGTTCIPQGQDSLLACPLSGLPCCYVPTLGEPWPLPGTSPAVCAGITALCFREVSSTGCAGRQRQLRGVQAPTTHLPRAQQQQHPSLSLCSADHPSSARQRLGRISSVKAPANPSASG